MMKQETKTGNDALLQAAAVLRGLSRMNYYDTPFKDMLGKVRKADSTIARLERKNLIPESFARRQPINGIPREEGISKISELCGAGQPFLAVSYALSVAEKSVVKATSKNAEFVSDVIPLKAVYLSVKDAIGGAAIKLEEIAEGGKRTYGYNFTFPNGFLGC